MAKQGISGPIIVLFRRDLRLEDNPALNWAARSGQPVVPLFAFDRDFDLPRIGSASRWWLRRSLKSLAEDLVAAGGRLVLRSGKASKVLPALAHEIGASTIVWNRLYDPVDVEQDRTLKSDLRAQGLNMHSFNSSLLFEPWNIKTESGSPYRVFTPFWRRCLAIGLPSRETMQHRATFDIRPTSESIDSLIPEPDGAWLTGLESSWTPGTASAKAKLDSFIDNGLSIYRTQRDLMARPGTSRLSPHLHFGEIGPRQIVAAVECHAESGPYLRQLGWREFSANLLFFNPDLRDSNLRREFDAMPWRNEPELIEKWRQGLTGYPLVDAGMRQLMQTGWMHNRTRMVTASFLTKHLLMDWQQGAAWFHNALVDADVANNVASWQWTAGCGADAAPYFRIFNPVLQSQRFDPDGIYLCRWLPELAALPKCFVHAPWSAPEDVLSAAGIALGEDYPWPVIDHSFARKRALELYSAHIKAG